MRGSDMLRRVPASCASCMHTTTPHHYTTTPQRCLAAAPQAQALAAAACVLGVGVDQPPLTPAPKHTSSYATNPDEVRHLWKEIFTDRLYLQHGIELAPGAGTVIDGEAGGRGERAGQRGSD